MGPSLRKPSKEPPTESSVRNTIMPGRSAQFAGIEVLVAGLTDVKLGMAFKLHREKVYRKDEVDWKRIGGMGRLFIRRLRAEMWLFRVVLKWSSCGGGSYTGVWSYLLENLDCSSQCQRLLFTDG